MIKLTNNSRTKAGFGKKLLLSALLVCVAFTGFSQGTGKVKITGTVTDEMGEPFPFVDVFVTNTTLGTVTDSKGRYELTVDPSSSLTFNFLGYRTLNF